MFPTLRLRDGSDIPFLAFGAGSGWFKDHGEAGDLNYEVLAMTKAALAAGFRHIDCSEMYNNEEEVGLALRESGIPREEVFLTVKAGYDLTDVSAAIDRSLEKLKVTYIDLYLIHDAWDLHLPQNCQEVWKAMEAVKASGRARSIGVSSFMHSGLQKILAGDTTDPPTVNQLDFHAFCQRDDADLPYISWKEQRGVRVGALQSVALIARCNEGPLVWPVKQIAERHHTTEKAVVLSWLRQQQIVVVVFPSDEGKLTEYLASANVHLTDAELCEIAEIGKEYEKAYYDALDHDDGQAE